MVADIFQTLNPFNCFSAATALFTHAVSSLFFVVFFSLKILCMFCCMPLMSFSTNFSFKFCILQSHTDCDFTIVCFQVFVALCDHVIKFRLLTNQADFCVSCIFKFSKTIQYSVQQALLS